MKKTQSYKDLIVWQKSMELVKQVYLITEQFPKSEIYGLTSQMQRAAVAVPSNIAEGYLRKHNKEFQQFLAIALGSAAELETQVLICKSIHKFRSYDFTQTQHLLDEIMRMLFVMIERMKISVNLSVPSRLTLSASR